MAKQFAIQRTGGMFGKIRVRIIGLIAVLETLSEEESIGGASRVYLQLAIAVLYDAIESIPPTLPRRVHALVPSETIELSVSSSGSTIELSVEELATSETVVDSQAASNKARHFLAVSDSQLAMVALKTLNCQQVINTARSEIEDILKKLE